MKKRTLTDKEYDLYRYIISAPTKKLYNFLEKLLKEYKYDVVTDSFGMSYIVATGEEPICLVAHLDTVFPNPPKNFFYDRKKNVAWSPYGGVGDDRLGVFLIVLLLQEGFRPHIIFTMDEEQGGIGASDLTMDMPYCPFKQCYYFVQLDRHGINDAVFYDCDNKDFAKYITSAFNFVETPGLFSDISVICPAWRIAGVNLSIGYVNEHTYMEHVYFSIAFQTLNQVRRMISTANVLGRPFIYQPLELQDKCDCCGKHHDRSTTFPVLSAEKDDILYYCLDCISNDEVKWCGLCGQAFIGPGNLCPHCLKEGEEIIIND